MSHPNNQREGKEKAFARPSARPCRQRLVPWLATGRTPGGGRKGGREGGRKGGREKGREGGGREREGGREE